MPQLQISLPSGLTVVTSFQWFDPSINNNYRNGDQKSCNYIGNLVGDSSSVISATGCSGLWHLQLMNDSKASLIPRKSRKMQLTIFSSSTNVSKFTVDDNGKMYVVKSNGLKDVSFDDPAAAGFRQISVSPRAPQSLVTDELVNDSNFPQEINITIAYGYDKSVKEYFMYEYLTDWKIEMKSWIRDIHTHAQSSYWLNSLKSKINLKVSTFELVFE